MDGTAAPGTRPDSIGDLRFETAAMNADSNPMTDPDLIEHSLALVAARCADPAPLVYARLFQEHPEVAALFVNDRDGGVRGQMLAVALEGLLDHAGPRAYAAHLLRAERVNHEGLGVPPEIFDRFFDILVATFRDLLGADWTVEIEAAWARLLAGLRHDIARIT